jgi:hypothetical protein
MLRLTPRQHKLRNVLRYMFSAFVFEGKWPMARRHEMMDGLDYRTLLQPVICAAPHWLCSYPSPGCPLPIVNGLYCPVFRIDLMSAV